MHLLMTAPCLLGLEGLVADELRFTGSRKCIGGKWACVF